MFRLVSVVVREGTRRPRVNLVGTEGWSRGNGDKICVSPYSSRTTLEGLWDEDRNQTGGYGFWPGRTREWYRLRLSSESPVSAFITGLGENHKRQPDL